MKKKISDSQIYDLLPKTEKIEQELYREKFRSKYMKTLRSTIYALIIVAAVSVLIATLILPILQIYGNSMEPTFHEGNIVICVKKSSYTYGDICSFYYNNKILVKRVIACPFDYVDIDEDGIVSVNGEVIEETYIEKKALGKCDITLPYQVPENSYFVMGDNRAESDDSRLTKIGCINKEEFVGKLLLIVWPFKEMKFVY